MTEKKPASPRNRSAKVTGIREAWAEQKAAGGGSRMAAAGASRLNENMPGASALRTKPIRVTVDLDPALYRRVKGWAESIAVDLDVPSVPLGGLFRALAESLADDPAIAAAVTAILRRNSVRQ